MVWAENSGFVRVELEHLRHVTGPVERENSGQLISSTDGGRPCKGSVTPLMAAGLTVGDNRPGQP